MGSNHRQQLVRQILRNNPEGLTIAQLTELAGTDKSHISRMLHTFPDAYIDRWIKTDKVVIAVWCVVVPPEHCPRPDSPRSNRRKK